MLRLWVKDNISGRVHEYGSDRHDALVLQEDGSLHYENMQACVGTRFPMEGYSFCHADGTVPDLFEEGDEYLDIGGINNEQIVLRGDERAMLQRILSQIPPEKLSEFLPDCIPVDVNLYKRLREKAMPKANRSLRSLSF